MGKEDPVFFSENLNGLFSFSLAFTGFGGTGSSCLLISMLVLHQVAFFCFLVCTALYALFFWVNSFV